MPKLESFPLRCQCGAIQGKVDLQHSAGRALCYCKDCRAYAHYLGRQRQMLDAHGGTDIAATVPRDVHITSGADKLICMSLSEKGILRWHASCCKTAIGNTPRDPKISYVGLVRECLAGSDAELDAAFGPADITLNTESARGKVAPTRVAMLVGGLTIVKNLLGSRLSGQYKNNPFFKPGTATPIAAPRVVSASERNALNDA